MLCASRFSFSQCKVVLGACFGPQSPSLPYLEHPFLSLFRLKEPERGWKSDMRTLSWKRRRKPSKRREFWHHIFLALEVKSVWSWNSCTSYFDHYNYSFCSTDLTKSRYTWSQQQQCIIFPLKPLYVGTQIEPGLSWAYIPTGSEGSPEVEEDVLVSSPGTLFHQFNLTCLIKKIGDISSFIRHVDCRSIN